jgi:hypothetical protein
VSRELGDAELDALYALVEADPHRALRQLGDFFFETRSPEVAQLLDQTVQDLKPKLSALVKSDPVAAAKELGALFIYTKNAEIGGLLRAALKSLEERYRAEEKARR